MVSLVDLRRMSAPGEQRFALLTVTVHSAVCTWLVPIAFNLLPSAFIAGSSHAPTLLHWHQYLGGLSRGGHASSNRCCCRREALLWQLPLPFRRGSFILVVIF